MYLLGRSVVKLVTPGTLVEPLSNHANYLLCINPGPSNTVGLAWVDISTAEFSVTSTEGQNIEEDIERICPSEVCVRHNYSYQKFILAFVRKLTVDIAA